MIFDSWKSPIGTVYILADQTAVHFLGFKKPKIGKSILPGTNKISIQLKKQLGEYFAGKRKSFDLPIVQTGTEFQQKVWQSLLSVPYGETTSYGDLAAKVKRPKAFRAVGSANGANNICILVPCHRVIQSNGHLGGYSGGIKFKKALLRLEQGKN